MAMFSTHSKRVLTFNAVEKTPVFDHLSESYSMFLSVGTAYKLLNCFVTLFVDKTLSVRPFS